MTDTPNLPAVDDAIEGTVVDPWHVTAEHIEFAPWQVDRLFLQLLADTLLGPPPPPPPDHHAGPSIRVRMAQKQFPDPGEWYRAGMVPGFKVEFAPDSDAAARLRRFQAYAAIGLSVNTPGHLLLTTGV